MTGRRELDLLIACATPGGAAQSRLAERAAGVDWTQLETMARHHRVRPLVYRRLLDAHLAPSSLRHSWEAALRANAVRTMHMTAALIRLARAFEAQGLAVLPHKGPLLTLAAYGDYTLREFADLDILVPAGELDRAMSLLAGQGYAPQPALAWLSPAALRRWTGETSVGSKDGLSVDLHWRLTPPHYPVQLDPAVLWPQTRRQTIGGVAIPTLGPEAAYLLLAVHGAKHAWEAVGWLADLAWLVAAEPEFDWALALDLASAAQCRRPLLLASDLIHQVFGAPMPEGVLQAARGDRRVARLRRRVLARWDAGRLESPRSPELLGFAAALSPSRLALLRHLAGLVLHPTERDWAAWRAPEPFFFLYAPARLTRLAGKYLSAQRS